MKEGILAAVMEMIIGTISSIMSYFMEQQVVILVDGFSKIQKTNYNQFLKSAALLIIILQQAILILQI